ncbi:MAG TPA: cytochrome b N-terminal domain-containing protein [Anaerolineales bacterium]|nr:cytochrome b N-terminal domain-containing protein [Anaerolineales bacterium]
MAVFKPHFPFLNDIKNKGLMPAVLYKINESVERLTAGLDIEDIRSVLRGDPPPRPNPRVKPHADGFWFHMRPTYYHNLTAGLYPSFRLGWLSTYFFAFETITGLILMLFYTPSPLVAYENMLNLLGNVPFGRLMRDLHKLGAEVMVWVVFLHMIRTFITGNYKKPRQFTWFTGVVLLLVTLILSFSGYLLPWDQLSLWAVTIGASMAEAIQPQAVGDIANLLLRGGPQFNEWGLLRWYLGHVLLLPLVGFIFLGVHYYKVVIHGHSLPPESEPVGEDTAKRVPTDQRTYFMPDVLTRELFYVSVTTFLLVASTVFWYHAPLEPHAEYLITPLHTTAPWYFLWLQGMLKVGDKFLWGVILPGAIFNGLMILPYLEVGPSRRYGDRRVGLTVGALVLIVLAILSYMGTPHYAVSSSPDQEVVAELLPQTEPGPLRTANWAELTPGTYTAAEWESAPTETLKKLLHTYEEEMVRAADNPTCRAAGNCLVDGEGLMIVEDWQEGLKKITFRVTWGEAPEDFCLPGAQNEFCQTAYFHRDSNYGQGE